MRSKENKTEMRNEEVLTAGIYSSPTSEREMHLEISYQFTIAYNDMQHATLNSASLA